MSLDVINAQGAQVVALQERVIQLEGVLVLLADKAPQLQFDRDEIEAINERVEGVSWKVAKSGRVTITVNRPK